MKPDAGELAQSAAVAPQTNQITGHTAGGINTPVVLAKTTPKYTDEALRAKVSGVVLLQAVVRKDGRADNFKVIRGLGHGLEESAIREIASNWKFRPATRQGKNIDSVVYVEVDFQLR